jgi:phosphoglycerol transferase MdoB-like AlkP superfamily enzyme
MALLTGRPFRDAARRPDIDADLPRYGLSATLLLYWMRWRATPNPRACAALEAPHAGDETRPEIIVIVQCESFADPVELTGDEQRALAGLRRAQSAAWQWGDLSVSGFGAYTMRTEYGLLFGRSEAELGFRRYDPFLTAHGETSYALSARLAAQGYHCLFVHPHDMRFYGRDRLMPAIGFDRLIGEESFAPVPEGARYVDDGTLGASLGDLIDKAAGPTLIYAVTMENHGPWDMDKRAGAQSRLDAYLRHLRSSDAMLTALIERLSTAGKPALLVFFGDHRPSIPDVTQPGGDRHTPYAMLRFARDGTIVPEANRRVDLTPDELHHAVLACVRASGRPEAAPAERPARLNAVGVQG